MNADQELSRSVWMDVEPAVRPPLTAEVQADVVVIGAGIAGLSVAYELQAAGRSVVVLDRGTIGGGQTARSSGHLSFECDDLYDVLTRERDEDAARAWYESQSAAVDRIETICAAEGIDAEFARVDGFLIPADVDDRDVLDREQSAAGRAGFSGVEFVNDSPIGGRDTGAVLRFPRQARFHPLKYVLGLAAAFERAGGRIFGDTAVTDVTAEDGTVAITLESGLVLRPPQAVSAANAPLGVGLTFHSKQAPYRTYVIAAEVEKDSAPDILLWDTADPYTYVRLRPGAERDLLIVGGQDHKSGTAQDHTERFEALEGWTQARFPQMGQVTHRWSGQVYEPSDHVPFIGAAPGVDGLFLVTGDSGEGLTTAVAAGLILPDLMGGRENPWAALYDPSRTILALGAVAEFVKEQAGVVGHLFERLTSGDAMSADELEPGSGAVLRSGGSKIAAYRDNEGVLHQRSAVCTHAGCVVHFNALERCWDCPCHGSQFAIDGSVLAGPATKPLEVVK